ncbi:MAG: SDR family oxidoreductase [Nevskiales bacterium]|nr:SDR family oxidoreductase [Nevskiales bacterium]
MSARKGGKGRKAVLITGAAAGIGRAIAERFARAGWFVGLYDRDVAGVEALAQSIGADHCLAGRLDVTDPAQWAAALETFFDAAGGRLDLLVNNAGILSAGAFVDIPLEAHHAIVDVNIKGVFTGCHAAFPYLRRTRGARVINLASASATYGSPGLASYSASKFAVRGISEALDVEWQAYGIRVLAIWPLFVKTAMVDEAGPLVSIDRLGVRLTPDDVAEVVWKAAHASAAGAPTHWPVGQQARLLMQGVKFAPARINRWIVGKISGH